MTNQEWISLIEQKREELEKEIFEAWKSQILDDPHNNMREVVLLWDDGKITRSYRDHNTWSVGEHNGKAILIASFPGGRGDDWQDFMNEFQDEEKANREYVNFMLSEYPLDVTEHLENTLDFLKVDCYMK
jgi:2-hydroxy-3-keto-5-methylthiopentenyl-1-phosphate phosphatase